MARWPVGMNQTTGGALFGGEGGKGLGKLSACMRLEAGATAAARRWRPKKWQIGGIQLTEQGRIADPPLWVGGIRRKPCVQLLCS